MSSLSNRGEEKEEGFLINGLIISLSISYLLFPEPNVCTLAFLLDSFTDRPNLHTSRPGGGVAQLVEHLICIQGVAGSTPVASTIFPYKKDD